MYYISVNMTGVVLLLLLCFSTVWLARGTEAATNDDDMGSGSSSSSVMNQMLASETSGDWTFESLRCGRHACLVKTSYDWVDISNSLKDLLVQQQTINVNDMECYGNGNGTKCTDGKSIVYVSQDDEIIHLKNLLVQGNTSTSQADQVSADENKRQLVESSSSSGYYSIFVDMKFWTTESNKWLEFQTNWMSAPMISERYYWTCMNSTMGNHFDCDDRTLLCDSYPLWTSTTIDTCASMSFSTTGYYRGYMAGRGAQHFLQMGAKMKDDQGYWHTGLRIRSGSSGFTAPLNLYINSDVGSTSKGSTRLTTNGAVCSPSNAQVTLSGDVVSRASNVEWQCSHIPPGCLLLAGWYECELYIQRGSTAYLGIVSTYNNVRANDG